MTVSLLEILAAARAHAAPLAAESAGYLLLAVADHLALSPRLVSLDDVELQADGSVRVRGRAGAASVRDAEQIARRLLARTLEVSSSVGPALRRAADRREPSGLEGLVRELEVALIPVNRSAARRALTRLHRETERARDQGKLDALLRAEQEPPAVAEPVIAHADFPDVTGSATPAPALPVVVEAPVPVPVLEPVGAAAAQPAPSAPQLMLSPPPLPVAVVPASPEPPLDEHASEEPALTKPEPVVERARERGSSTPKLGTVITAQTLPSDEPELTERAPTVALHEDETGAETEDELDLPIEVELPPEPALAAAEEPQPLLDPSPSRLPDVLTAMVQLHAGIDPDEAPTRLRDVITAVRPPAFTPEPAVVEDAWLTHSSLEHLVIAEPVDPAVHEALTWNPGPVASQVAERVENELEAARDGIVLPPAPVAAEVIELAVPVLEAIPELPVEPTPLPESLLIAEPVELSPYAPAVLPGRESDVSELLDSFHVTSAAEERELRAALKEMAGLDLTPLPGARFAQGE